MQPINLRAMAACLVFGLAATFVQADDATYPPIFREAPVKRFNSTEHPRFDHIERELRNLVAQRGSHLRKNYFCASGFELPDGLVISVVLWKNKDEMLWWRGSPLKEDKERAITLSRSPVFELKKAIDDSNGQRVNLGTTGIYRSDAKAAREDCQKYGQQFVVQPLAKSKSKAK